MTPCWRDAGYSTLAPSPHQGALRGTTCGPHGGQGGRALISYDPNYRPFLWPSVEAARRALCRPWS